MSIYDNEPPTAGEVERLRRKVAAGAKLAAEVNRALGFEHAVPRYIVAALREWEAADK